MAKNKVSIIGAGNVGATATYYIAEKVIADLVMVDVAGGMTQAKALDFLHAGPLRGYDVSIVGTSDFAQIADSNVVVITAGLPRKPGMDRMDLLKVNAEIVKQAARAIAEHAPNAIVIAVSNPLDIMCHVALRATGFALRRVVGMAGILDSTRFRYFVAEQLGCALSSVHAMVLGGHGDQMVPLPRLTTVGGRADHGADGRGDGRAPGRPHAQGWRGNRGACSRPAPPITPPRRRWRRWSRR